MFISFCYMVFSLVWENSPLSWFCKELKFSKVFSCFYFHSIRLFTLVIDALYHLCSQMKKKAQSKQIRRSIEDIFENLDCIYVARCRVLHCYVELVICKFTSWNLDLKASHVHRWQLQSGSRIDFDLFTGIQTEIETKRIKNRSYFVKSRKFMKVLNSDVNWRLDHFPYIELILTSP